MIDDRFNKIRKLLSAYALGDFDKKLPISREMDEIDAFVAGVNMLGEELKDKTISRNYFNNIFNSVSDMVFVLNMQGKIENINNSVTDHLEYDLEFLRGKPIGYLLDKPEPGWFNKIVKDIHASRKTGYETILKPRGKNNIPALISASLFLIDRNRKKVVITAKDMSAQKETHNIVLKAIIETEEKERIRFAKDIHDSLGQQLSAIKMYIAATANEVEDPKQKNILLKANAALIDVQADMRNICFNIMPKSLEMFGLVKAVEELVKNIELKGYLKINIKHSAGFPKLSVHKGFALFRIIQEFINNALKHSKADTLNIEFSVRKKIALITLADNGVGFDMARLRSSGMGLNNVRTRIRPYHGEVEIISRPGKGTRYEISIPIEPKQ